MANRTFANSGKGNPCPICDRSKDGDCRISDDLILCRIGGSHRPPTEKAGTQVTGKDGSQWICRGPANDAGWIQFSLAGTSNGLKSTRNNNTRNTTSHPQPATSNCTPTPMAAIAGSIDLARLAGPLPEPPPDHLPNGYRLDYSPAQRVVVKRTADGGKGFPVQHLKSNGDTATWEKGAGPDPWPLWRQAEAIQHGPGRWVIEDEGEKCVEWTRAGGLVAISQPGHAYKLDQIKPRYLALKEAGITGIVYLADNDDQGRKKALVLQQAAASVGLNFLVLHAGEVWPGLPAAGSIDDAPGTPAERVAAIQQAIPTALEKAREAEAKSGGKQLLELALSLIPSGWHDSEKGPPSRTNLAVGDACRLFRESVGSRLAFNTLTKAAEFNGAPIEEEAITDIWCCLSEHGYSIRKEQHLDALLSTARQRSFHPVRQYLETIEKDPSLKPGNLDTLAETLLGNTSPLAAAMLRKTMIGAVSRAMNPGCKFDYATVLKGTQGWGKSSVWKVLASPAWFLDTMPESHKDLIQNIHSCWFYELAELESVTGKKNVGALKNLITSSTDKFRAPYAHAPRPHDRSSVFVGTVNNDTFLFDETGNRRFWTIEVFIKPDLDKLLADRDGLWKAAVLAYREGELPRLSEEQEAAVEAENKAYVAEDPWMASISRWAMDPSRAGLPFDTSSVITGAELRDQKQINPFDARRAATCLKQLGYVQDKNPAWSGGRRGRFWREQATRPLTQMTQLDTDEGQASVSAQTPDAPTDLNPLTQMTQINLEKGLVMDKGGVEGRGLVPPEEKVHKFSNSSVSEPQGGQNPCGSSGFTDTDTPKIICVRDLHLCQSPQLPFTGKKPSEPSETKGESLGHLPSSASDLGAGPFGRVEGLAPETPQNTPSDPIATAEMDLANLLPWQQSAITLKLANPTAVPAALINLIPQGELPRGANGATIKTFLAQPQIVELLAQHGEAA